MSRFGEHISNGSVAHFLKLAKMRNWINQLTLIGLITPSPCEIPNREPSRRSCTLNVYRYTSERGKCRTKNILTL